VTPSTWPRWPLRLRLLLVFLHTLGFARPGIASPDRVELAVDGPKQHRIDTKAAVEEALLGLDVELVEVRRVPTVAETLGGAAVATSALARIRVNLLSDQLQLVISDRSGKGIYIRSVPYNAPQAPLAYEQVAQILRSTIVTMTELEREAAKTPGPPRKKLPLPSSPPPPRASVGGTLSLAGVVALQSQDLPPVFGGEISGGLRWGKGRHHAVARLSGGSRWANYRSDDLSFALHHIPIFGIVGYRLSTKEWRFEPLAGAGLMFVRVKPNSASPDIAWSDERGFRQGVLRLALRVERRITKHVGAFASLRTDFLPSRKRLLLAEGSEQPVLVTPFAVQPSIALGLSLGD